MAEAALKKLEDQLNCLICLDTYTNPKQLQCFHVYCQTCLVRLVVRDQHGQLSLTCPTCRQVTPVPANGVAGLQSAFTTNHLLDILEEHKRAKKDALYCADHQERELELSCETCDKLICLQCVITEHNVHQCRLLKEVFEESKQEILAPAEEQLKTVNKALEEVDARKRKILDQQIAVEAKMNKYSKQLVEAIQARTSEHISKLHCITEEKLKDLASQREQMEITKTQLSSYLDMVGETLVTGSQGEVINMKTTIDKQVKELTASFQLDTLEPITKADVGFSTTNKAMEVCRRYGELVALGSLDSSECRATGDSLISATVGERSTAVLQVINYGGQPYDEPINLPEYELIPEIKGTRARGFAERRGQSQYEISYLPTVKGRHQLHIKVEGQHIRGSPFSVAVKSPVQKLGTPILTVVGVKRPWGVAVNQTGDMIVTEQDQHRVSVFSASGKKLRSFGTHGSGQGQFVDPTGVAMDGEGNVFVVDWGNDRVQKFTTSGKFLAAVGTRGSGPLQFISPRGIAFSAQAGNKIYVGDGTNGRVQILNSDLTFSGSFGSKGNDKGQFDNPRGIACDSHGNVYVADRDNNRIQVFTAKGFFLRFFERGLGFAGRRDLKKPIGVAIDTDDTVYVSESDSHRVFVFTYGAKLVTSFGKPGKEKGAFENPRGLAVDNSGVVYVCDHDNHRVQMF